MKIDGNKTYIGLILLGILGLVYSSGWLPWLSEDIAGTAFAIIGTFTGVSYRHALKKAE